MRDKEILDNWMIYGVYRIPWHRCQEGDCYTWASRRDDRWFCSACEIDAPQKVQDFYLLMQANSYMSVHND